MATTYNDPKITQRIREPLFQVNRVRFRGSRESQCENLETNFLQLDLTRILNELESIDIDILNKLSYLIGETADVTNAVNLNDGLTYSIDDVNIFIDKDGSVEEALEIDVMNKISSKLSRLLNKIQRLENGN
jgi:ribosome maturation factor RimP